MYVELRKGEPAVAVRNWIGEKPEHRMSGARSFRFRERFGIALTYLYLIWRTSVLAWAGNVDLVL